MANTRPDAVAEALYALCVQYLRQPDSLATDDATGHPILTFTPALSSAEQATLADLTTMARFGVSMTLAEWQSIKADAATLKAYYQNASPTNAQSVAAIKAVIHVLSVIVRS